MGRAARGAAPLLPYTWVNIHSQQQPPQYSDSLVIKNEDILHEEEAPEYSDAIGIRMEEEASDDSNSDVIIKMENDEVEEEHLKQEQLPKNDEVISETHNPNEG